MKDYYQLWCEIAKDTSDVGTLSVVSTDIPEVDTCVAFMDEIAQLDSKLHQNRALVVACCCVPDSDSRRNIADVLRISSKVLDELPARDPEIPAPKKPHKPQDTTQDAKSYSDTDTFKIPPSPPLSVSDIISRYSSDDGGLVDRLESLKSATPFLQARQCEIFEQRSYFEALEEAHTEIYPCIDCVDEVDNTNVPPVPRPKSPNKVFGKLRSWTRMGIDRAQSDGEDTDGLDGVEGGRKRKSASKRASRIRETVSSRWRRFTLKRQDTRH